MRTGQRSHGTEIRTGISDSGGILINIDTINHRVDTTEADTLLMVLESFLLLFCSEYKDRIFMGLR